jgi:hypothetical protein
MRGNCLCFVPENTFTVVSFTYTASNSITLYETELQRDAREIREALEERRLRHRAILSARAAEARRRKEERPRLAPPPPAPPWQTSVMAFRGRSGSR